MCNFKVLAQNVNGYVLLCPDCNIVQLAFGTAMIKLRIPDYEMVGQRVRLEMIHRTPCEQPNLKNIVILLDEGMMFCLTFPELVKLEELLKQADVILETYRILDDI